MNRRPYLVIGAGMAGGRAAEFIAQRGKPAEGVVLAGAEPHRPYHRPPLSKSVLLGDQGDTFFRAESYYAEKGIELHLSARAVAVDARARTVAFDTGEELGYTALIVAPGAKPRTLALPGADLPHVHYLRTLTDAWRMREALATARRVVVVGSGFIGSEAAAACRLMGVEVTVIETASTVLPVLGEQAGDWLKARHEERGVRYRLDAKVTAITGTDVHVGTGENLPADLVIVGIGVQPDVGWLGDAVNVDGGIEVDEYTRTRAAGMYAAGDAVCWPHPDYGFLRVEHETHAQSQGAAAARAALGGLRPYRHQPYVWSDQGDLQLRHYGYCRDWDDTVVSAANDTLVVAYLRKGLVSAVLCVNHPGAAAAAERLLQPKGPFPAQDWLDLRL